MSMAAVYVHVQKASASAVCTPKSDFRWNLCKCCSSSFVHIRMVNIFAACLHSSTLPCGLNDIIVVFLVPHTFQFRFSFDYRVDWDPFRTFSYIFISTPTRQNVEVHRTECKKRAGNKNRNKN